jgi:hypothetical protein
LLGCVELYFTIASTSEPFLTLFLLDLVLLLLLELDALVGYYLWFTLPYYLPTILSQTVIFPHEGFLGCVLLKVRLVTSMWEHVEALEDRRILYLSMYLSCGSLARVGVLECLA